MDKFKMSKSQIWEKFLEKKNFLVEVVLLNVLSLNKNRLWFTLKNKLGNEIQSSFAQSTVYIELSTGFLLVGCVFAWGGDCICCLVTICVE